jgi:transposase
VTNDEVRSRSRLRLFALAKEMGSVRAACRMLGVHHSTYYRWQRQLVRFGTEILHPRERRRPRMPNAISPMVEQRVLALALANRGWGPQRLSLELGRPKWGGLRVSGNGVWRVLKRHGLNTRAKRLGGRFRRAAGAGATAGPSGAPPQGRPPWSSSSDGRLLHRPPERDPGRGLAVPRHRCRFRLHLGRASPDPQEPLGAVDLSLGPTPGQGAGRPRLAVGGC